MKFKVLALASAMVLGGVANAANYIINNVANGPGDTIYTNQSNTPLTGAVVTIGYFSAGFDVAANLGNAAALKAAYTIVTSGLTGGPSETLGGNPAGYAEYPEFAGAQITVGNPLLGRTLYSFVGNAATLDASSTYALFSLGPIGDDVSPTKTYVANPAGKQILIGGSGTVVTNIPGAGQGTYKTLQLVAIPEPSAALLGMLGALGLLRRRR